MNTHRGPGGDKRGATPGPQRPARPGIGAGAGQGGPERRAATWALGFMWIAAAGVAVLLMQQGGGEPDEAELQGLASGDLVSTRTQTRGWRGGTPRQRPLPGGLRSSSALAYTYQRVLRLGDPAPEGGAVEGHLEIHGLNNAGQVVIVGDDPEGEAMFLVAPGMVKPIVRPGAPAPAGRRFGTVIYMPEAMNNRGQVVWSGTVENRETWSFLYDSRTGKTTVVQRPGTPAPGGGAFLRGERQCPEINNRGEIAFHAYVAHRETGTPVPGIFVRYPKETVVVAREGTPAPNGGQFRAAEFAAINDAGVVVFHGMLEGSDGLGVYRWRNGTLTAVAGPGTALDDRQRLEHAVYPQVDRSGGVVFVGLTRHGAGLYRWDEGTIQPIVEPGSVLPGIGPMRELEFNGRRPFDLNAGGAVAFIAHGMGYDGVFVWDRGKLKLVAHSEATLPPVGAVAEVGTPSSPRPRYGPPGTPYGYAPPPGATPPGSSGPPGAPPGAYGPYGAARGGYGPPGGGYGTYGRSFGIGLSDDGKVAFLAAIKGEPCLLLATPKPVPGTARVAHR